MGGCIKSFDSIGRYDVPKICSCISRPSYDRIPVLAIYFSVSYKCMLTCSHEYAGQINALKQYSIFVFQCSAASGFNRTGLTVYSNSSDSIGRSDHDVIVGWNSLHSASLFIGWISPLFEVLASQRQDVFHSHWPQWSWFGAIQKSADTFETL